mmetsp:Transcript_2886/g.10015  ORF Transcript_2886/g.10015 Transcript_2886/m.10015 type:complete len:339 (+) Transcript_2886:311-1327(+)
MRSSRSAPWSSGGMSSRVRLTRMVIWPPVLGSYRFTIFSTSPPPMTMSLVVTLASPSGTASVKKGVESSQSYTDTTTTAPVPLWSFASGTANSKSAGGSHRGSDVVMRFSDEASVSPRTSLTNGLRMRPMLPSVTAWTALRRTCRHAWPSGSSSRWRRLSLAICLVGTMGGGDATSYCGSLPPVPSATAAAMDALRRASRAARAASRCRRCSSTSRAYVSCTSPLELYCLAASNMMLPMSAPTCDCMNSSSGLSSEGHCTPMAHSTSRWTWSRCSSTTSSSADMSSLTGKGMGAAFHLLSSMLPEEYATLSFSHRSSTSSYVRCTSQQLIPGIEKTNV